jgi:hypothetical protein
VEDDRSRNDPFGKTVSDRQPKESLMAVRIQHQPRRHRRAAEPLAEVTAVVFDETALIEAADHVVDRIDEAVEA